MEVRVPIAVTRAVLSLHTNRALRGKGGLKGGGSWVEVFSFSEELSLEWFGNRVFPFGHYPKLEMQTASVTSNL